MRSNSRAAAAIIQDGRIHIRLPRNWFEGKQRRFALGLPATEENLLHGQMIAAAINRDHLAGQFDSTFAKYRQQPEQPVSPLTKIFTLSDLWEQYCEYKKSGWKPMTVYYYVGLTHWIDQMPQDWKNALAVRSRLVSLTTNDQAARVLDSLDSCIEWALRTGLLEPQRNPYRKMGRDLKGKRSATTAANALSPLEQVHLLAAFREHPVWCRYEAFAEFLFLTGCRPSEAVGVTWRQIATDFSTILFDRSITRIGTEWQYNTLSKTNRARTFYCSDRLKVLLFDLALPGASSGLIFSVNGNPVNYDSFSSVWKKLAAPILGRASTPYSARDTFITRQVEAGKPVALIAKWVDNSTAMIEKKYLDTSAIRSVRPD
jgi:integrase